MKALRFPAAAQQQLYCPTFTHAASWWVETTCNGLPVFLHSYSRYYCINGGVCIDIHLRGGLGELSSQGGSINVFNLGLADLCQVLLIMAPSDGSLTENTYVIYLDTYLHRSLHIIPPWLE